MRRIISLIMASVMCICIFAVGPVTVSAAGNEAKVIVRLYDGKYDPAAGNWYSDSAGQKKINDTIAAGFVSYDGIKVLPLKQLSDGTAMYMFRGNDPEDKGAATTSFLEEFETYFELYHAQTEYPVTIRVHFRDKADAGIDAVTLDNGVIKVNGNSTGYYYEANKKYAFKVIADPVNDTVSTYLVSGPVSETQDGTFADLGEEKLLKESTGLDENKIGFVRRVSLMATNLPTTQNVDPIAYFKEIKLTRLPCEISLKKEEVKAGDTTISLKTNSWLESSDSGNQQTTTLPGNVIVKRNGKALTPDTDYTVSATTGGRTGVLNYARNPVITLTKAAEAGDAFEIDFSNVSTARGVALTDQKLKVKIDGVQEPALTKDAGSHTFTVKGTADGYAGTMLVAEYNKATKSLIKVLDIIPVNMEGNFEETYTVENYDSEHEYRAFFWQLLNMTPVLGSAEF